MHFGWQQIWGGVAIAIGILWIARKIVPISFEGQEPFTHATGKFATILGLLAIILGVLVALEVISFSGITS